MYENIKFEFETLSPISHVEETDGITSKFRRLKIKNPQTQKIERIPFISGNSIRGVMRRYGARYLLEQLEIKSSDLPESVYYVLFSGGTLHSGVQVDVPSGFKKTVRENLPLVSIFGAIVWQEVIAGKLNVDIAIPIVKETDYLTGLTSSKSCWDILQEIPFSRRDDLEDKQTQQIQQMQYYIESIIPGVKFLSGLTTKFMNEIERACLLKCLLDFKEIGVIGGNARMGYGKILVSFEKDINLDYSPYENFLKENKQKISDYIFSLRLARIDDNVDIKKIIKKHLKKGGEKIDSNEGNVGLREENKENENEQFESCDATQNPTLF